MSLTPGFGAASQANPQASRPSVWQRIADSVRNALPGQREPEQFGPFVPQIPTFGPPDRDLQDLNRAVDEPFHPMGRARLDVELQSAPHKRGTPEYDDWLLSLREDPQDPEYNIELRAVQGPASRRREMRMNPQLFEDSWQRELRRRTEAEEKGPLRPSLPVPGVDPEGLLAGVFGETDDGSRPPRTLRPEVVVLGPDGQPLPDQFVMAVDGSIVPFSTEVLSGITPGILTGTEALQSGQYVWIGDMLGSMKLGNFDRTTLRDTYMDVANAANLPYHWSAEQIAYAQEAMGLEPTGFVDQALIQRWEQVVVTSAGYTQAGRRMDPFTLLDMVHNATQAARRGSGGGGGGGSSFSRSETTLFLNRMMLEEVGREANDTEADQFWRAMNGAGTEVDPTQFAIEWIRSVVGEEAGAFQVATDYYEAMLAILGGRTQAEDARQ